MTASAMVTRAAQDCSLAASDRNDTTPMPAEALTGSSTWNATTFDSSGNFSIEFVQGKCVEVSGGRSINGGAGINIQFAPRSAVDLLLH